jgi:hypothetical protein
MNSFKPKLTIGQTCPSRRVVTAAAPAEVPDSLDAIRQDLARLSQSVGAMLVLIAHAK